MTSRLNQLRLLEREYDMKRKTMLQAEHLNYGVLVGQLQQIQDEINYREHKEGTVGSDLREADHEHQ